MTRSLALACAVFLSIFHLPAAQADSYTNQPAPLPVPIQNARSAVVRIETTGTQRPIYAAENPDWYGSGTGFLIDSAGHVLTNAHVVNASDTISVFFDGSIEPVAADLVGMAECADLALLDLEGDGYPALTWASTPVARGDVVYALGYPDAAFDIVSTSGTVRGLKAEDATEWASIGETIWHNAPVDPGNSGGPLLNAAGEVVGVTFAEAVYGERGFAIAADEALGLLDRLKAGEQIASIGVRGEAFHLDDERSGLWVEAIQPGSPAALAGILPGDIVRTLDGEPLTEDGTLNHLCRLLEASSQQALLPIEVLRPDDSRILHGELNGAPLTVTGTLKPLVLPTPKVEPTPTPAPTPRPDDYATRVDETGLIALQAPRDWNYQSSSPDRLGSVLFSSQLTLAGDERAYLAGHSTPFVIVRVDPLAGDGQSSDQKKGAQAASDLDELPLEDIPCNASTDTPYVGDTWAGQVRTWSDCDMPGDPLYMAASLHPRSGEPVQVTAIFFSPAGSTRFPLTTLLAPLAASLLPRVPFWEPPQATVLVPSLNVRSGPDTTYDIVTQLGEGEVLSVIGKDSAACNWIYFYFTNLQGWASAKPEYLSLDRPCADLAIMTDDTLKQLQDMGDQ